MATATPTAIRGTSNLRGPGRATMTTGICRRDPHHLHPAKEIQVMWASCPSVIDASVTITGGVQIVARAAIDLVTLLTTARPRAGIPGAETRLPETATNVVRKGIGRRIALI